MLPEKPEKFVNLKLPISLVQDVLLHSQQTGLKVKAIYRLALEEYLKAKGK